MADKDIMIDNGAFSARRDGVETDEQGFFHFIEVNRHLVKQYTMNDFYYDSFDANIESYRRMVALGLDPIYIIHMGEPFALIEKLFNGEYGFTPTRLGWGGAAKDTPAKRMAYVGKAVSLLPDPDAVKIHGFGMVSQFDLLRSFPFDSADASTYANWATNRELVTPWKRFSLKHGDANSVHTHPLREEVEKWLDEMSYEVNGERVEFSLEALSAEGREGHEIRQLYGMALYAYLEEGFQYINHMKREMRFIPWETLKEWEPDVLGVPTSKAGDMNPIGIIG